MRVVRADLVHGVADVQVEVLDVAGAVVEAVSVVE